MEFKNYRSKEEQELLNLFIELELFISKEESEGTDEVADETYNREIEFLKGGIKAIRKTIENNAAVRMENEQRWEKQIRHMSFPLECPVCTNRNSRKPTGKAQEDGFEALTFHCNHCGHEWTSNIPADYLKLNEFRISMNEYYLSGDLKKEYRPIEGTEKELEKLEKELIKETTRMKKFLEAYHKEMNRARDIILDRTDYFMKIKGFFEEMEKIKRGEIPFPKEFMEMMEKRKAAQG